MPLTVLSVAYPLAPVSRDAVGGAEQVLHAVDAALVEAGHRSLVLAAQGSRIAGTLLPVPAETGVIDGAARERAWARHRAGIAEALRRWPVDLVHLHGIDFDAYLPEGVPCLVTLHLPLDWYAPPALKLDRDDVWLHAVSASQQRTAPQGVRLLPPIPNGIDVSGLAGRYAERRYAKRRYAMTLGRICPEKGVHLALDAARLAEVPLLVAGQVYRYEAHERYFDDEVRPRLGPTRRFVGPLAFARKRRLLAGARCLLVPSLAPETSSLVAMEAMACGTPVIAYPAGALPEIVEEGVTGFIVHDVAGMAAALKQLHTIAPEACRTAARRRFDRTAMQARYLDRIERLVRRPADAA